MTRKFVHSFEPEAQRILNIILFVCFISTLTTYNFDTSAQSVIFYTWTDFLCAIIKKSAKNSLSSSKITVMPFLLKKKIQQQQNNNEMKYNYLILDQSIPVFLIIAEKKKKQ